MRKILWIYTKLVALLLLPLALIIAYANSDIEIATPVFALEKVSMPKSIPSLLPDSPAPVDTIAAVDTIEVDTMVPVDTLTVDTTRRRVLLIGDSMLEGLRLRMADYAMENGYDLMAVVWYSSNTLWYSKTDTIEHFIAQHQPDFIMVCIGGNEQFVRDLDKRAGYVQTIMDKIGDIPFVWIGTPSWRKTTAFNDRVREVVGDKRFYDSSRLTLARREDHAHPTTSAAAQWMDSVAVWMSSAQTAHPIRMDVPTEKRKRVFKSVLLQPNCP